MILGVVYSVHVKALLHMQYVQYGHKVNMLQVLTPADDCHHINKHNFKVPFVCGCRDIGEALRRVSEGAAMIRTKVSNFILLLPQQLLSALRTCTALCSSFAGISWRCVIWSTLL